jgi:putative sigma-54 modulation protein
MQIEITGRHVEITEPIKQYVEKRLRKFSKLFVEPIDVHVILSIEKHRQSAEIVLKSKLFNLTSIDESTDMYNSVNKSIEKIERQALKQKEKVIGNKRQPASASLHHPVAKSIPTRKKREPESRSRTRVIMEELKRKKPMGVEEAVIDLSESDRDFVVFRDSESDDVHVLYKRKDGHYGLIRPD